MMLVDRDDVEAELLGIDQLVDIGLVFLGALDRIVEPVRQHHPGRALFAARRHVERPVRHQMEADEFHRVSPLEECEDGVGRDRGLLDVRQMSALRHELHRDAGTRSPHSAA